MKQRLLPSSGFNVALAASLLLGGCGQASADDLELGTASLALEGDAPVGFTPATAAALTGRIAGTAVALGPLANEPAYAATIVREFSDITPENATKWGELQKSNPKAWDFAGADTLVDFAAENGLRIKGHTIAWHSQLPAFITPDISAGKLNAYLTHHINNTVPRYEGDMFAWDVVNEAIADDGSGLRDSVLSQKLGEEFIVHSFKHARAKDHDAELYYNDYNIETVNAKSDAVYALMQRLLAADVPVHGVGMQGHLDARFAPSVDALVQNFQRFGELGLSVNISELDVRVARVAGNRARKLAVQKQIYQTVAAACVQSPACTGITTWGFTDAHSWIDSTFEADDPLLFDEQYQKKPAYFGFIDGFAGVPLDGPGLEPNLIANATLEAGLDGWSVLGSGTLSLDGEAVHTGHRSAKLSGRTAAWNGPQHNVSSLVRSGRTYDVSVWARLAGASSATTNLTAALTCGSAATQFIGIAQAAATDSGWVQLAGSLAIPAACTSPSVAVYVEGPAPAVDILVDDLALRERPLANLITNPGFEVNTAGWFGFGPSTISLTTDALSGANAAIATNRTATWNGIATNILPVVQAEGAYQVSANAKIRGAASAQLNMTAAVRCQGGSDQFISIASRTGSSTSWTELSGSLVLPNCPLASVTLYVEGPPAGVDILIDDVAMSQQESTQGPNVITNRDFEAGTAGWFPFGAVSISATTARARTGLRSALVTGRTATFNGIATSLLGAVTPGRTYNVRGYAQVSTASAPVRFTLQSVCSNGTTAFTTLASATATNTAWAELNGSMTVPNCTLTTANFYIEGPAAGTDIYLDDVSVRERL